MIDHQQRSSLTPNYWQLLTPARPLVCSMLITPAVSFAAGGNRGSIESVAEREKARRADYIHRGHEAIDSGDAAMKDKDYEKATAYYKNACDIIPNAPNSQALYD